MRVDGCIWNFVPTVGGGVPALEAVGEDAIVEALPAGGGVGVGVEEEERGVMYDV